MYGTRPVFSLVILIVCMCPLPPCPCLTGRRILHVASHFGLWREGLWVENPNYSARLSAYSFGIEDWSEWGCVRQITAWSALTDSANVHRWIAYREDGRILADYSSHDKADC